MPIDFFFRSLAQDKREKAIGVLLSGSGSDGTLGIREIHAAGGIVIVQEPATAQFDFMIQSALATGLVDSALPPAQIAAALLQYVRQADGGGREDPEPEAVQDDLHSILGVLASQTGSDFHSYKKNMVWRRIQRRMGLNQITDISDYGRLLREKPDELARLSKDMLIGVTSFFRDSEAFDELRIKVISPLVQERNSDQPLRAWAVANPCWFWTPACSSCRPTALSIRPFRFRRRIRRTVMSTSWATGSGTSPGSGSCWRIYFATTRSSTTSMWILSFP
jgi:two-component system CheB/CheR fusion protein